MLKNIVKSKNQSAKICIIKAMRSVHITISKDNG